MKGPAESTRSSVHSGPAAMGFGPVPELQNRPRSEFENSLMSELACTCGDCKLELINACRCDFASKMRSELLAQLDGIDVSTEAARRAAAEAVRASFVARHGPKVLDRTNRVDPNGRIAVSVVGAIFLTILVVMGRHLILGRVRQRKHADGDPP